MKVARAGGAPMIVAANEYVPRGLAVDETTVYWATGDNEIRTAAK